MDLAIETEGLSKTFRRRWSKQEFRAVQDVSLRVERGTTFGLLGPNGAGKTTFVKMLLSCSHPTAGRAKVFGMDSRIPDARRPVGYLPENHRFPTYMTGRAMLDFYGALSGMNGPSRKKRIAELLAQIGLEQWGDVRLGKYSKGMLQRVGLAQALMHEPALLILDEPGDGVDPVCRRQIRDILTALEAKGVTIFHKGKLALEGKVADLIAGSGYRVEVGTPPDRLVDELRLSATSFAADNGQVEFHFPSRESANRAVDLLRAEKCEIEAMVRTKSTLEEVFIRTIDG